MALPNNELQAGGLRGKTQDLVRPVLESGLGRVALAATLLGGGAGGLLTLNSRKERGETDWGRRRRAIRNALVVGGLAGAGSYAVGRGAGAIAQPVPSSMQGNPVAGMISGPVALTAGAATGIGSGMALHQSHVRDGARAAAMDLSNIFKDSKKFGTAKAQGAASLLSKHMNDVVTQGNVGDPVSSLRNLFRAARENPLSSEARLLRQLDTTKTVNSSELIRNLRRAGISEGDLASVANRAKANPNIFTAAAKHPVRGTVQRLMPWLGGHNLRIGAGAWARNPLMPVAATAAGFGLPYFVGKALE